MWSTKEFEELSLYELQEIYALRVKVFVVEQNCPYQEVDRLDLESLHLFKRENGKIVAYARLIPGKERIQLGRLVVHPDYRKRGLARKLLAAALSESRKRFGNLPVHAQAQAYLERFYQSFGFQPISAIYLEDGIPHLDMVKTMDERLPD